ncbi:unnamed protein product [Rhodiola kirilowii]
MEISRLRLFLFILSSLPFALSSLYRVESSHFYNENEPWLSVEEEDGEHDMVRTRSDESSKTCDLSNGTWVYDVSYPLYDSNSCPYLSQAVTCRRNGRPDSDYEKWRWEPHGCSLQRFDALKFLAKMRKKRLMFVGDSIMRNQWESLVCLVQGVVPTGRKGVSYNGPTMSFHALDYEMSIQFCWAPLLVELEEGPERQRTLHLDLIEENAEYWKGADVLVFDSAHWWTHSDRNRRPWDKYMLRNKIYKNMNLMVAYEQALATWSKWIDQTLDQNQTRVIFRSMSPRHNRENGWKCYNQKFPLAFVSRQHETEQLQIVRQTLRKMRFPVYLQDITMLSAYRRDAHPSVYRKFVNKDTRGGHRSDCSNWCLPGVPDNWNEMLSAII